ncbi:hypothetical protein K2173_014925 [Erythroxylum novogranatense]|uniref:B-like cyclin n=1 Tax=Erythroxylum novogranatense TaxID=1862640 RepID=A0AAV8TVV2_9ROSI|nr:hypothetical protein K2173_014925 [Erythroxylum novogranatense]
MASRPVVPQQARGDADVGFNNKQQKKNVAAVEGRSRRALGDIGNHSWRLGAVDAKKDQAQISRPLTRSLRAQLLANAEVAVVAENNKKQVRANVDGAEVGKKPVVAKANKNKKVTVKPKPEEVIEISPDSVEQERHEKKKKEGEASTRKKAQTLSSVLTARSKAACGLGNKLKKEIIDIDAADAKNDLAGVEYVEDIYKFYKLVENESRPRDYMSSQPEINEKMRAILVDWLIDVHQKFELSQETLFLTVNIIDRFLSQSTVPRRELQLLGMSATLIASKYEEIWAPEVNDLVCISDRAYSHEQILIMEKTILGKLEWTLTVPTYYVFLARFIKASIPDVKFENTVYFLAELGVMHYETITFCPSMVAASAVYAARCILSKTPLWTDTLEHHCGYSESQLKDCAGLLAFYHSKAAENKLQTVLKRYSSPLKGAVALLPPAKCLLSGVVNFNVN